MSAASPPGPLQELGRFLEIQNLGLNLPFALAFLLLAADGLPSLRVLVLVIVAFVAARNAGHSFNRWTDRAFDAANPRTRDRALPAGRFPPSWALVVTAVSAAVVVGVAYLLNPLALVLAPIALALILGYSYSKRVTPFTTVVLGLVQSMTPAAAFVAVQGELPLAALVTAGAILCWGTAFETVHSLGDLDSDRALGLRSLPLSLGTEASIRLVVGLHAVAMALLTVGGLLLHVAAPYFFALAAMALVVAATDIGFARQPTEPRVPFQRHFVLSALFLAGVAVALFVPGL